MSSFPCPYCGHAVTTETQDEHVDRCPSCDGSLLLAYRYRLVAARGAISGGALYEAVDDGFGDKVAVIFVKDPTDDEAVERFVEGNRLFAELGGRGLAKLRELGTRSDRRPYVVMDWITNGTLEAIVGKRGPLDQALMFEVARDLLTGLSKAHRSMPALVHGHVHPGKIGFLSVDQAVLFGFEWAAQVADGPRSLADAFVTQTEPDTGPHRETDLQQLGRALYYAATGEWIADQAPAQQRARVREQITGALGRSIDRMLGAGEDGYTSAIDALTDFDALMRGRSGWKPKVDQTRDHSDDLAGAAWVNDHAERMNPSASLARTPKTLEAIDFSEALEDLYEEEEEDDDDDDDQEVFAPPPAARSPQASSSPQPVNHAATARAAAFAAAARKRELIAKAAAAGTSQTNPLKLLGAFVGALLMFGMCVAAIGNDDDDFENYPAPRGLPPMDVERAEPTPERPPQWEQEQEQVLSGLHHYTGTITGPEQVAGLEIGDRCELWVEPQDSGSLNCRWYIDCGEPARRIYGGGTAGFSTCTVGNGHPMFAQDDADDAADGAFTATLSRVDPMVMVMDRWLLPPTLVVITIDQEGGAHPGPIPHVPLALRLSEEAITAAIVAGEGPSFEAEHDAALQLSPPDIEDVLANKLGELRQCSDLTDVEVTLTINIHKSGQVRGVLVSPGLERSAETCITRVIRQARFPSFEGDMLSIDWNLAL